MGAVRHSGLDSSCQSSEILDSIDDVRDVFLAEVGVGSLHVLNDVFYVLEAVLEVSETLSLQSSNRKSLNNLNGSLSVDCCLVGLSSSEESKN